VSKKDRKKRGIITSTLETVRKELLTEKGKKRKNVEGRDGGGKGRTQKWYSKLLD